MPSRDTLDLAESIWLAANLLGLLAAAVGLMLTNKNLRAARRAEHLAQHTPELNLLHVEIARENVRSEVVVTAVLSTKLIVFLLFGAVGYLSALTPTAAPPVEVDGIPVRLVTLAVLVIGAVLLAATSVMLTVDSMLRREARHRIVNKIAARVLARQLARRQGDVL